MSDNVVHLRPEHRWPTTSHRGGGNGHDLHGCASVIEARLDYLATKEDIQRLEKRISDREASLQRWLIGVLLAAIGTLGVAIVKLFGGA